MGEIEQKKKVAVVSRIQARFRGLKARSQNKGLFAAVVELKIAREKENELRKEQERVLDVQRKREEEAKARAEEKAAIQRKLEAIEQKRLIAAATRVQARFR